MDVKKATRKKIKTTIFSVAIALIVILFALEAYMLTVDADKRTAPLPANYGNFGHVSALLANDNDKREEFSFGVVGDTRSFGTYERISAQLSEEPLSFIVILGDFVQKGTFGEHQFYRCEMGEPIYFPYPVFHVVGNHELGRGFELSDFEKTYGSSNFSFSYRGHLFILLRTLPTPHPAQETLAFLEQELSTKRRLHDKVFVFTHIPPVESPAFPARPLEDAETFVELFEKYQVDYIFSADYHGHSRLEVNDVNYIITGGGGAHLKRSNIYGNFHHAMVIKVKGDAVSEHILQVDEHEEFEDRLEHLAVADVSPWIMDHKPAVLLLNLLVFALLILACYLLVKNIRANLHAKEE
mgnify:CR=1 FL=1